MSVFAQSGHSATSSRLECLMILNNSLRLFVVFAHFSKKGRWFDIVMPYLDRTKKRAVPLRAEIPIQGQDERQKLSMLNCRSEGALIVIRHFKFTALCAEKVY